MGNTGEIVLDALITLERENTYSSNLILAVLNKYAYLEDRDRAYIKHLFEGCVERRIELDYRIGLVSKTPVRKMKPLIRNLIRMGAYQLLYMDGVPDHAAINETVKLARKRHFDNLAGFCNGVLRSIQKQRGTDIWPDAETNPAFHLSVKYSVPEWIVEMWLARFGFEKTQKLLADLLAIHPVTLRFRTDISDKERETAVQAVREAGAILTLVPGMDYMYHLQGSVNVAALPGYDEGLFTVQDITSALAVEKAGIAPGDYVIDACCAPGGKTLLASERCGASGHVLARDISERRLERVEENILRMGAGNVTVVCQDAAQETPEYFGKADVLLLDVPCSGFGIFGKKRDIKYNASPEMTEELIVLQRRIIDACWKLVRIGGTLLYSTCTINERENEEQVRYICGNYPFEIVGEPTQLLPEDTGGDGFFYCVLKRTGE